MAWAVGLGQLVAAVFPGTSRSGITILLCLILGLNRPAATEFCFLVGIPTMLAAGAWKIFKALHHPAAGAVPENWAWFAGFRGLRHRLIHRCPLVAALHPNSHIRDVRVVSNRSGGVDCRSPAARLNLAVTAARFAYPHHMSSILSRVAFAGFDVVCEPGARRRNNSQSTQPH